MSDRWAEFDRLADLRIVLLDETGSFIDARPFAATAFDDRTPLMDDIRRGDQKWYATPADAQPLQRL